jgi:hypothetical protein
MDFTQQNQFFHYVANYLLPQIDEAIKQVEYRDGHLLRLAEIRRKLFSEILKKLMDPSPQHLRDALYSLEHDETIRLKTEAELTNFLKSYSDLQNKSIAFKALSLKAGSTSVAGMNKITNASDWAVDQIDRLGSTIHNITQHEKFIDSLIQDTKTQCEALSREYPRGSEAQSFWSRIKQRTALTKQLQPLVERIKNYLTNMRSRGEVNKQDTLYALAEELRKIESSLHALRKNLEEYITQLKESLAKN